MKAVCYLRVAKTDRGDFKFGVTTTPSNAPLIGSQQLPTRQFKIVLNLPKDAFTGIDGSVEIDVPEGALQEVVRLEIPENEVPLPAADEL